MTPEEMKERLFAFFHRRQRDYSITFSRTNLSAQRVLADIFDFGYLNKTIANAPSEFERGVREGRRQMCLRINRALNLTPEEQFNLNNIKDTP